MFSSNTSQVSEDRLYVEDVFSTYLFTGTGSSQTINNGIDLAGKGGLVWYKTRNLAASHSLRDSARGPRYSLASNTTSAQADNGATNMSFNSNGFTHEGFGAYDYASWTFRKAPKFFDVVTWSGNNTARTISHSLGVAPGVIIVKAYSGTDASTANWAVYHRSLGNGNWLKLETTDAALTTGNFLWTSTAPTATEFSIAGGGIAEVNKTGNSYVAYLFAHDATADGLIQCGTYTGSGTTSPVNVTLGWEPQLVLTKRTDSDSGWVMWDVMRGMSQTQSQILTANDSGAEGAYAGQTRPFGLVPTATGFSVNTTGVTNSWWNEGNIVYIAIRRGPMKTPMSGTSVFKPLLRSGTGSAVSTTGVGFPPDLFLPADRNQTDVGPEMIDRLRGIPYLVTSNTSAENSTQPQWTIASFGMDGVNTIGASLNSSGYTFVDYYFRRAPSFFDVVCYTGNDVAGRTINHNLGVVPEMIIVKGRIDGSWWVQHSSLGPTKYLVLNTSDASGTASSLWNNTAPTSSVFTIGNLSTINFPGYTYVAYLFASCPGVSKIGTYTGNGSSQTINCGFAAGARFVMIKRTDSTGSWWVWDTARGLVSGNDPALQLNSTAAETTGIDSIDPDSSGFIVNQDATTNINVSGGTYIYMSVA